MQTNSTASDTTMTNNQFVELSAAVMRSIPRGMKKSDAQHWITHSGKLKGRLRRALSRPSFDIWKTIKVDGYSSPDSLLDDLESANIDTDQQVQEMVHQEAFSLEGGFREIDLVKVTPWQLGFRQEYTPHALIEARARELDLFPLPYQVAAVNLRLAYTSDTDMYRSIHVSIHPVPDSRGYPYRLYMIDNDGKRCLYRLSRNNDEKDQEWVFFKPRRDQ